MAVAHGGRRGGFDVCAFDMFYDCVEDARAKGHDVLLRGAPSDLLGLAQAYAGQKKPGGEA